MQSQSVVDVEKLLAPLLDQFQLFVDLFSLVKVVVLCLQEWNEGLEFFWLNNFEFVGQLGVGRLEILD